VLKRATRFVNIFSYYNGLGKLCAPVPEKSPGFAGAHFPRSPAALKKQKAEATISPPPSSDQH